MSGLRTLISSLRASAPGRFRLASVGAAVLWAGSVSTVVAQDDTSAPPPEDQVVTAKPSQKKHVRKPARPVPPRQKAAVTEAQRKPTPPSGPPAPAQVPAPPSAPPQLVPGPGAPRFTAQLQQAGTRTCVPQLEQLAGASMQGVTAWNTASHWMTGGADTHAVSLFVGQQYRANANVPFGVTGVFAAPSGVGKCDAMSVQVVPSPLPCAKLRESLQAAKGKQIGDLVGIPLMQDLGGQTMLVPTGANGCVLVAFRGDYAN